MPLAEHVAVGILLRATFVTFEDVSTGSVDAFSCFVGAPGSGLVKNELAMNFGARLFGGVSGAIFYDRAISVFARLALIRSLVVKTLATVSTHECFTESAAWYIIALLPTNARLVLAALNRGALSLCFVMRARYPHTLVYAVIFRLVPVAFTRVNAPTLRGVRVASASTCREAPSFWIIP